LVVVWTEPLRLAFCAREGCGGGGPLRLAFRAREGCGGGWWCGRSPSVSCSERAGVVVVCCPCWQLQLQLWSPSSSSSRQNALGGPRCSEGGWWCVSPSLHWQLQLQPSSSSVVHVGSCSCSCGRRRHHRRVKMRWLECSEGGWWCVSPSSALAAAAAAVVVVVASKRVGRCSEGGWWCGSGELAMFGVDCSLT